VRYSVTPINSHPFLKGNKKPTWLPSSAQLNTAKIWSWNKINMDGRFYSRKSGGWGGWGLKRMGDGREVIHTTVFGSDRAKYPCILYKNAL